MREIKFRAWEKPANRMLYEVQNVYDFGDILRNEDMVVMQFAGLKDKNGKNIYEGDILLCGDGGGYFSQEYDEKMDEYVNAHKATVIGPTDIYPAFDIEPNPCHDTNGLSQIIASGEMEVIGNIHENPELLEEKAELN